MSRVRSRTAIAAGLALVCALALALRSLGFETVFPGNGEVLFAVGDGHYHARLAFFSFVHFPAILTFDPYLNYPEGAAVPVPPLLDFVVAAVARLAGGESVAVFEHVLAWSTPVYGALAPLAVFCAARTLAPASVALGAGAILAALPAAVFVGRVGDADHHAAVSLLGTIWLALVMAAVAARGRRLAWLAAGVAAVRLALLLSWSGCLLYVALADGSLLLAALLARRRDLLAAQAASAWASGLLVLPLVRALPEAPGGAWSSLSLSQLQPWAVLAVGGVAAVLAGLEAWRPSRGALASLARGAAAGLAVAGASWLLFPGLREGLLPGLGFVATAERTGTVIAELQPLSFFGARPGRDPATHHWGLFAYAIPLAPLAALAAARDPGVRASAGVLALWTAALGALAVWQVRYGNDFAPSASIAFALLLGQLAALARRAGAPRRLAGAAALGLGILAFLPPVQVLYAPRVRASWRILRDGRPLGDPALASPSGSLVRFLESVRRATPETSGWLDAQGFPEYGVLNSPSIGHALHYVARRASASDGLLESVDSENFAAARRFFQVRSEAAALAIAKRLHARYVITMHYPGKQARSVSARLHRGDGAGEGGRLRHFRLVTEGPAGGRPLGDLFGFPRPADVVPYKLFEIVPGALLEVRGAPGANVEAAVEVRTPAGRRFEYAARATVADDGVARLRVPYATASSTPARALGPWRVRVEGTELAVHVSEADVLQGRTLSVPARGPRAPAATSSAGEPPRA
jgi:dolichyl-diphosphooligosaccharide--protein glycosyltransferase